jgi:hypothetical protein
MEKEDIKNNITIALGAGIFIIFLRTIPFFVSIPKLVEQVLPLAAFLIIPLIWMKAKGLGRDWIGLSSIKLSFKETVIMLALSIPVPIGAMIIHQVIEEIPIVITHWLIGILASYILIQAPLMELFWRGFVQKSFAFKIGLYAIPLTAILTAIAWVPCLYTFPGAESMAIPAKFLESVILGSLFFVTNKLLIAILGRAIINSGIVVAHSYDITNNPAFLFGPPV